MAGDKVNTYAQDDSDILALQLTTDKTFKGYHQLTLTNYDNTTVPAIAAGSAIECNGALYKFDTEEAISTTDPVTSAAVADGTVYVVIVPDTTTATAAFTATAPTWSDSKQGWYGTGGRANYRYIQYCMNKLSTAYSGKTIMFMNERQIFYYTSDYTERSTTSTSRIDETNMTLTIPIKQGKVYEVILVGETTSSYSPRIFNGLTTKSSDITYIISDTDQNNTYYEASAPVVICKNSTSVSFGLKLLFYAKNTTSYSHRMSWYVNSGTAYINNRQMFAREISGILLK